MRASFTLIALWLCLLTALPTLTFSCHENEREALLKFKEGLIDQADRLSSWVTDESENCCSWAGVVCGNITHHVVELHLGNSYAYHQYLQSHDYEDFSRSQLGGEVNPSLLGLKHLSYLDLSYNDFEGRLDPKFIGSMETLRYLNLSYSGFSGLIPHQLGNLSNLRFLDIGRNSLYVENVDWISGISKLKYLDMSWVDLSEASKDWVEVVTNSLPSLKELHLSHCNLHTIESPVSSNFSSLIVLDLSLNHFSKDLKIPSWIFKLHNLISLDLSECGIQGPIPVGLQNLSSTLQHLDLSHNQLNSSIPNGLYSFKLLESLDLHFNNLNSLIYDGIGNLTSIVTLDLSYNKFEGKMISKTIRNFCNMKSIALSGNNWASTEISEVIKPLTSGCVSHSLESLRLWNCHLFGEIPESLGSFKSLREIYIFDNKLNGSLPIKFGQLVSLERVIIRNNSLEGIISEVHFSNLTMLKEFDASQNQFTLKVSSNWVPHFKLEVLDLSNWHLGPSFPSWLFTQTKLRELTIAQCGINDTIPTWFWSISIPKLNFLNLSRNQIHGEISNLKFFYSEYSSVFDLSYNNIIGNLPIFFSNISALILNNNSFDGSLSNLFCQKSKEISFLSLKNNLLSGEIPDCFNNFTSLGIMDLENNFLSGSIPNSIGNLSGLESLHLRKNILSGVVPNSLEKCNYLIFLGLGENDFVGKIPNWIGKSNLKMLSLHSNKFSGDIPHEICQCSSLQILDLADNNLSGKIPKCLYNLTAMVKPLYLDQLLYHNSTNNFMEYMPITMKGREFTYDTILTLVTNIDLSSNNLSGEIPMELTRLMGLIYLNLSHNSLTGSIPEDIGKMRSLLSVDFSFNQLFGEIPSSITSISFLSYLNLSYNKFSGKIPTGIQLQSFERYSYVGNNLCGPPISDNCSTSVGGEPIAKEEEDGKEVDWFYVTLALGFVVGFGGIVCPLVYNRLWRFQYFRMLDRIGQKIWEFTHFYKC